MNIKNIGIIIGSEYRRRVRKKSFLVTTFLMPLLMGLCMVVPALIMMTSEGEHCTVKVIDNSGVVMPYLDGGESIEYLAAGDAETVEQLRGSLKDEGLYAVVAISSFDSDGNVAVTAYSDEPMSVEVKRNLSDAVNTAVSDHKMGLYNIDNLDEIMASIHTDIKINAMTMTDSGDAKEDSVELYMVIAYIASFLIYMFVLMFGNSVMTSVIEEKTSRVVEVLVSSVKSVELMMGKIFGVALVAITQFAIWVAVLVAVAAGLSAVASDKLQESGGMEMVASMAAPQMTAVDGTGEVAELMEAVTDNGGDDAKVVKVLNMVKGVNWGFIIVCFLIYFVFGYLLYASMFAAVGASVDNASDTGQLSLPVTAPLLIGLFIMLHTFEHPSSQLSLWASLIPWTSPMVMLARVPFGTVPAWQLIVSIALLAITFVATAYLSARIYRSGILAYGKKSTFKDLFKWMKQK